MASFCKFSETMANPMKKRKVQSSNYSNDNLSPQNTILLYSINFINFLKTIMRTLPFWQAKLSIYWSNRSTKKMQELAKLLLFSLNSTISNYSSFWRGERNFCWSSMSMSRMMISKFIGANPLKIWETAIKIEHRGRETKNRLCSRTLNHWNSSTKFPTCSSIWWPMPN